MPFESLYDYGPTSPIPSAGGSKMGFIAPLIGAGASVAGAAMGGKGQKQAAQMQAKGAADALAFQREQAAREEARYNQQVANYQQQVAQYNAGRNALLSRYGIDIGEVSPPVQASVGAAPGAMASAMSPRPAATGTTLGDMIGERRPAGPWNDWATYGLQRRT